MGGKNHRFGCQQSICLKKRFLLVIGALKIFRQSFLLEELFDALQQIQLPSRFLVIFRGAHRLRDTTLNHFQISEDQFEVDRLDIAQRIDAPVNVHNVIILKTAHDMHDRVHLTDIREKLVAEALAFGSALNQTGDIDKLNDSRHDLLCIVHLREHVQALIRHRDNSDIGIDCAERIVCRLGSRLSQRVEQSAFSDIRESDNS